MKTAPHTQQIRMNTGHLCAALRAGVRAHVSHCQQILSSNDLEGESVY